MMHPVIVMSALDASRSEEQRRSHQEMIVPRVKQAPGFVGRYWTRDPGSGKGYTMIIFEDEEAACRFKAAVEQHAHVQNEAGVMLQSVIVTEVVGHA